MKILHLDTGTGWRGGQQQVLWLMEGLRGRGQEQLLLAPSGSPLGETAREQGFAVSALASPEKTLANVRTLLNLTDRYDLVHAHDSRGHSLAWLAVISQRPVPWRFMVVSRRVSFPIGIFGGPKHAAADAYIAVSDSARQQLLKGKVPPGKIHIVHDGVRPPPPHSPIKRSEFRGRHGVSEDSLLLGTLTSLAPEKLLREQIELLEVLPPTVHLWMGLPALDGEQREAEAELLQYAKDRGLEERFQILQLASEMGTFLDSLDIFLYLSRSEGLGSAILLAMAHSLPVVASRVGGIPEIVRHLDTGLLVGENLKAELPAAIQLLRGSKPLQLQLGAAAREFILSSATSDIMVAKTFAVYEGLLRGDVPNPDPEKTKRWQAAASDRPASVLEGKS